MEPLNMFDNLTISYIKEIQEASQQNRLVAFVGAGASCDAGVPLWNDLVSRLADVLPFEMQSKYDNLQLAQLVRETIDEKAYYSSVRKHLLQNITCPNSIHDAILDLHPTCIITTNYDTLLEEAALRKNQQIWVVGKDSDLPQNHGERLLVKMHGDLDNDNIVLTENDYYDYSRNFPLIRSFVVSQFVSKVVVFIGFSFNDINLRYILREVQRELGAKMQKAFLLSQETPSPVERNNFKERGVNVLSITPDVAQDIISKLRLEPRPDHYLSERGRTLFNQLKILKNYRESVQLIDLFIDFFENQTDGLTVSGHYLKYAFPIDKRKGFGFEGSNLNLPDHYRDEFSALFASKQSIFRLWRNYGNKLQKLRICLLDSGVSTVNNMQIESISSRRNRLKRAKPSAELAFYQMDINNLMNRIKTLRSRSLAYNIEDLELPYALFLSGYYYDAYEIYSKLAPEMWKRRKYTLFFICLYNKRNTAWLAIKSIQDRKDMDSDEIKRFYYSCDLTNELNMLPLSECIHQLFSDLIYQRQLSDALIVNSDTSGKIAQQRKRAEEKTGWSLNWNIYKIIKNFEDIFDFCVDNYLVTDNNNIGQQFYITVVRSFFDSVLTPSDRLYSNLKTLSDLVLYGILFKISPIHLKELLVDVVGKKKLPVNNDFVIKLKKCVKNIFVSLDVNQNEKSSIKEHVLKNWIHNILMVVPRISYEHSIDHLDMLIARLWNRIFLSERINDITDYFRLNAPSSEAVELLLYESLESTCNANTEDIIDFIMAISVTTRASGIQWDASRLMKGVKFQGNTGIAAAILHATGNQMKDLLKEWITGNAKTLYDMVSAQNLTSEKLLTKDAFVRLKSNLYDKQNPLEELKLIRFLSDLYNFQGDKYTEIKESIADLAEDLPCLKFAMNPLAWPNIGNVDYNWMAYVSEDFYDDIIKDEIAIKKLKEYCETVPLGNEIKKIIWKKL